jgi:hypothetical protein
MQIYGNSPINESQVESFRSGLRDAMSSDLMTATTSMMDDRILALHYRSDDALAMDDGVSSGVKPSVSWQAGAPIASGTTFWAGMCVISFLVSLFFGFAVYEFVFLPRKQQRVRNEALRHRMLKPSYSFRLDAVRVPSLHLSQHHSGDIRCSADKSAERRPFNSTDEEGLSFERSDYSSSGSEDESDEDENEDSQCFPTSDTDSKILIFEAEAFEDELSELSPVHS